MTNIFRRFDFAKILFFATCGLLLVAVGFGIGVYTAVKRSDFFYDIRSMYFQAREIVDFESPKLIPNEFDGPDGLSYFSDFEDDGFLLLSGYFPESERSGIKLIRLSDGALIRSWYPDPAVIREMSDYEGFYPVERFEPKSPLLMEDGGLIFIDNQGPLVRINACSEIVWIVDGKFHHSLERGLAGELVVPMALEDAEVFRQVEIRDEAVAQVSLDGRLQQVSSVAEMLLDGGYRGLLLGTTPLDDDPLHLNDVEVAKSTTQNWKRGDWLLSLRSRSAIVLYRPSTDRIISVELGPWTMQHDPDFLDDGFISIFGNDTVRFVGGEEQLLRGFSNIYLLNPGTGSVKTPYEDVFSSEVLYTPTQGKTAIMPNGDAIVEETDRGRISRISHDGLVWIYQNTHGDDAGVLHWSRYVPAAEMAAADLDQDC